MPSPLSQPSQPSQPSQRLPHQSRKRATAPSATGRDWVQLAPYGRWPHPAGLQVLERDDAEHIANQFYSLSNLPMRLIGIPWYIGHPDHPRFAARYTDTRAYGRIKKLEARDDGLYGQVKWSSAGRDLIQSEAFHGHSVNWHAERKDNQWRPRALKSVGFTNEPNLPVRPVLANETLPDTPNPPNNIPPSHQETKPTKAPSTNPTQQEPTIMNIEELKQLLGLPPEATEDDIRTIIQQLIEQVQQSQTPEQEQPDQSEEEDSQGFANERRARIRLMVNHAIERGSILPSEQQHWIQLLSNEFETHARKLNSLRPRLNTATRTGNLGSRSSNTISRSVKVQSLVNEKMREGLSYDEAFTAVRHENALLFAEMHEPSQPSQPLPPQ